MKKPFTIVAVAVFSVVALLQLLRFILGWEVSVDGVTVPVWLSGIAFVIAAGLAVMLWRERRNAMSLVQKIAPCLWFDNQAEEAAGFYTGIFRNSRITKVSRYGEAGYEIHGKPAGSVLTVAFELDGQPFTALNGGPMFKFNEALSLQIYCDTQEELDYYWEKLGAGGDPKAQQCGWLKDRYGVSWQVVPTVVEDLMTDPDPVKVDRVMKALLPMKKLDIAALKKAYEN